MMLNTKTKHKTNTEDNKNFSFFAKEYLCICNEIEYCITDK